MRFVIIKFLLLKFSAGFIPLEITKPHWQNPTRTKNPQQRKSLTGFTMVEMVIVLAIITAISSVILVSFSGLNEGATLNRSARELALALRTAQNMSLTVKSIDTSSGPRVPRVIGIQMTLAQPNQYFIFADLNQNGQWDSNIDVKIGDSFYYFPRNITISQFTSCDSLCPNNVNIFFSAPEAAMSITRGDGIDIGNGVDIVLKRLGGTDTRTISIRTSGQISIK